MYIDIYVYMYMYGWHMRRCSSATGNVSRRAEDALEWFPMKLRWCHQIARTSWSRQLIPTSMSCLIFSWTFELSRWFMIVLYLVVKKKKMINITYKFDRIEFNCLYDWIGIMLIIHDILEMNWRNIKKCKYYVKCNLSFGNEMIFIKIKKT